MIVLKINLDAIDQSRLFAGKKGQYADLVLIERPDQYGNDGFVSQEVSREERERGVKGNIIGNWKTVKRKESQPPRPPKPAPKPPDPDLDSQDDIPF